MTVDPAAAIASARELRVLFDARRDVLGVLDAIESAGTPQERHQIAFDLAMRHGTIRAIGYLLEWSGTERARWLDSLLEDAALRAFAEQLLKRASKPLVRLALSGAMPGSFPLPDAAAWAAYRARLHARPDEKIWGDPSGAGVRGLWVSPPAVHHRAGGRSRGDHARFEAEKPPVEKPVDEVLSFVEALLVEPHDPRLVFVLGAAGLGKSTLAEMLADRLAARDEISPVLVRLRDLSPERPLLAEIERVMEAEGFAPGGGFLVARRVVLLLDGFDELGDTGRSAAGMFFVRVRELMRDGHVHAALVTGRDTLLQTRDGSFPEGADVITLQPFDAARVRRWGENWSRVTGHSFDTGRFLKKTKKAQEEPLQDVASHPLMLYMLARMEADGHAIKVGDFDDRARVYRTIFDWCCERHQTLRPTDRWKARDMRRFLRAAGYAAMARGREVLRLDDLKDSIRALGLETGDDPTRFAAEQTLLALPRRGEAEQTWEFAHRSFGEFLAAEQLAQVCLRVAERARNALDPDDSEETWRLDTNEATREWMGAFGTVLLPENVERYLLWILRGANGGILRLLRTRLGDVYRALIEEREAEEAIRVARQWGIRPSQVRGRAIANLFLIGGAEERFRPEEVYQGHFLDAYHAIQGVIDPNHESYRIYMRVGLQGIDNASVQGSNTWYGLQLYGIDAEGCDLRGIELFRASIANANFSKADLSGASLGFAGAGDTLFDGANLRGAYLHHAVLLDASLTGADLRDATLTEAWLDRVDLREADLRGADVLGVRMDQVRVEGAKLPRGLRGMAKVYEPLPPEKKKRATRRSSP